MYRSGLVPRGLAVLGLVSGALICVSGAAVLLGVNRGRLHVAGGREHAGVRLGAQPGMYLIVKGFKPSPVTAGMVEGR